MRNKNAGFTLIEALIAIVILATTFTAVWSWFNTALLSTQKIEKNVSLPYIFDQVMAHLELQDMEAQREGVIDVQGIQATWKATLIKTTENAGFRRQPKWIVALFEVEVELSKDSNNIAEFSTQLYKHWRGAPDMDDLFGPRMPRRRNP